MDVLEDLNNCVKINGVIIPAVNIQVEGFPKIIDGTWYPIYFEIMFEHGDLWVVEAMTNSEIVVHEHVNWAQDRDSLDQEHEMIFPDDWVGFVDFYESDGLCRELFRTTSWKDLTDV
jgi:hypothetical protein